MKRNNHTFVPTFSLIATLMVVSLLAFSPVQQADNPNPPEQVVKLIFIHHSSGENWLANDNGGLGTALGENNYFVSDTNYGWGPDSIGDRTDIPDWLEWFYSDATPHIMDAIYSESGQNSSYTKSLADPGGENEIIMFKSCFPNSNLDGRPDDPPGNYEDFTVAGAKFIYNEILRYFASRPDKLFIVITAPPVTDPTFAENARAFNNWLVYDWLAENDYRTPNVAVFDFYNVLTGPDNHHRFINGQIEHSFQSGMNTAYYPTDDDHPSATGNRKATQEFIPLLNVYYHRWVEGLPTQPPAFTEAPALPEVTSQVPSTYGNAGMITDFENAIPASSSGWVSYRDESTPSQVSCGPQIDMVYAGSTALQIDFDIPAGTWATCELPFDISQDWNYADGIAFYVHASNPNLPFNLQVFSGVPENLATFIISTQTPISSEEDWINVEYTWDEFLRAEWEADAGTPFETSDRVFAIAFGFDGLEQDNNTGTVWIDNLQLINIDAEELSGIQPEEVGGGGLPCLGSLLLPLMFVGLAWFVRRK